MGEYQEMEYSNVRKKELALSRMRHKGDDDENLANLRSKSRQICNIYLPDKEKYDDEEEMEVQIDEDDEDDENTDSNKKDDKNANSEKFIRTFYEN